ncbi:MAG: tRNA pseudouridine(55) synthase TruB [Cyanobacteriota bacterium]|nr:tRNA pseudouridine(55) synthase TruB [Cyanobacteriota bacterium]
MRGDRLPLLGFVNLNKPVNFTSHDCVAKLRRLFNLKRIGHGGTLDPLATGVLPIALGRATRLLQYLRSDKSYFATVRLGICTATDDLEGEVIESQAAPELALETVKTALEGFKGQIEQIPPKYSAIQVDGKRLYDLARSGQNVDVPRRSVEIYQIEVLDWRSGEFPEVDLHIACGGGTYIRSIARDLGSAVQTGGTLAKLVRTQSSGFDLAESMTFEELSDRLEHDRFQPIPPHQAMLHLPSVRLDETLAWRWCQGQKLANLERSNSPESGDVCRVDRQDDRFLGIGEWRQVEGDWVLVPKTVTFGG